MIDTPRYKELQELLSRQTDEKSRIDTQLNIAEEVKNFEVDEAAQMASDIIGRSRTIAYPTGIGRGLLLRLVSFIWQ